jgi:hypothetical protein
MNIYSEKLRLVLNELAILNQPEQRNGIFFYGLSQIRRIKELAAEAYILADLASTESARAKVPLDTPNAAVEKMMKETPETVVEESIVVEPELKATEEPVEEVIEGPFVESTPEPEAEMVANEPELEEPEVSEPEVITPIEKLEIFAPEEEIEVKVPEATIEVTTETNRDEMPKANAGERAGEFSKTVSMTRRFEYINKLFKGNGESYTQLVDKIESVDKAAALKSFSDCYYNLEWNRNQESADEFKALIVKFFD